MDASTNALRGAQEAPGAPREGYGGVRPTQELERVSDAEIVQPGDTFWIETQSEWARGQGVALLGNLLSAKNAAMVEPRYGEGSLEKWAGEMGVGRSTAYSYAQGWRNAVEEYGGEEGVSGRLDGSPLTIWQVIESMRAPRGQRAELLDRVEDDNIATRQIRRIVDGSGTGGVVEMATEFLCPTCDEWHALSRVETREVPV